MLCVKCIKFQLLDSIYDFMNQRDIVHDIALRHGRYERKLLSSNNLVIRNLLAVSLVRRTSQLIGMCLHACVCVL